MNRYLVTHEDHDAREIIDATTRGKAKHAFCEMHGLGDGFADTGFSIRKVGIKQCAWCSGQFEGIDEATCCDDCLKAAYEDGGKIARDILAIADAPARYPQAMRDAHHRGFSDFRNAGRRRSRMAAPPADEPMVFPNWKRE